MSGAFEKALALIDAANGEDPQREKDADGQIYPRELLYSRRMSAWLLRLRPDAGEALQLAVRAQHLRRWTIPRDSYPMDRTGYLRWRTALRDYHAEACVQILTEAGCSEDLRRRTSSLIRKERLKQDPEAQLLEDTACLVFLEFYFPEFASRHEEDKVIGILQKTWAKMGETGRAAALRLDYPAGCRKILLKALEIKG